MEGINKLSNSKTVSKQQTKNYGSEQNTENLQSIVNRNLQPELSATTLDMIVGMIKQHQEPILKYFWQAYQKIAHDKVFIKKHKTRLKEISALVQQIAPPDIFPQYNFFHIIVSKPSQLKCRFDMKQKTIQQKEAIQHQKFLNQLIFKLKNSQQSNQISQNQAQRLRMMKMQIQSANVDPSARQKLEQLIRQLQKMLELANEDQSTLSTSKLEDDLYEPNKEKCLKITSISQSKKYKDQAEQAYNNPQHYQQFYFYVSGVLGKPKRQKFQEYFDKTPAASQYARIKQFSSQLTKDPIIIIVVKGQCWLEVFEPVKTALQNYFNSKSSNFEKQGQNLVQIIQVSYEMEMQHFDQKEIIQIIINRRNDKCAIGYETLKFLSLQTAISYFSYIKRYTLFEVKSIPPLRSVNYQMKQISHQIKQNSIELVQIICFKANRTTLRTIIDCKNEKS